MKLTKIQYLQIVMPGHEVKVEFDLWLKNPKISLPYIQYGLKSTSLLIFSKILQFYLEFQKKAHFLALYHIDQNAPSSLKISKSFL